jgi:dTDP-4-amino-4,6-dideoxygalactose transaminase
VTTEDDALAEKARVLRVHGMKPKYHHHAIGANFRIDALQAAFLRVKLPRLAGYTEARRKNAAFYREALHELAASGALELPAECEPGSIWNQFVVRVPGRRDALLEHLRARKIGVEVYYPVPLHLQECFESCGLAPGALPVSEQAARETLALPIFPELEEPELRYVADAIASFFEKSAR